MSEWWIKVVWYERQTDPDTTAEIDRASMNQDLEYARPERIGPVDWFLAVDEPDLKVMVQRTGRTVITYAPTGDGT